VDIINRSRDAMPFVTKDGSTIREILAPRNAPATIHNQSLAEATVAPGQATEAHYHARTEEIYYVLQGRGEMRIGSEARMVGPGDAVAIPPGAPHQITNSSATEELVFLCCCAPAYTHEDTVMVDNLAASSPSGSPIIGGRGAAPPQNLQEGPA